MESHELSVPERNRLFAEEFVENMNDKDPGLYKQGNDRYGVLMSLRKVVDQENLLLADMSSQQDLENFMRRTYDDVKIDGKKEKSGRRQSFERAAYEGIAQSFYEPGTAPDQFYVAKRGEAFVFRDSPQTLVASAQSDDALGRAFFYTLNGLLKSKVAGSDFSKSAVAREFSQYVRKQARDEGVKRNTLLNQRFVEQYADEIGNYSSSNRPRKSDSKTSKDILRAARSVAEICGKKGVLLSNLTEDGEIKAALQEYGFDKNVHNTTTKALLTVAENNRTEVKAEESFKEEYPAEPRVDITRFARGPNDNVAIRSENPTYGAYNVSNRLEWGEPRSDPFPGQAEEQGWRGSQYSGYAANPLDAYNVHCNASPFEGSGHADPMDGGYAPSTEVPEAPSLHDVTSSEAFAGNAMASVPRQSRKGDPREMSRSERQARGYSTGPRGGGSRSPNG